MVWKRWNVYKRGYHNQNEYGEEEEKKCMSHSLYVYCISNVHEKKEEEEEKQIRIWIVAIHLKVNILSLDRRSPVYLPGCVHILLCSNQLDHSECIWNAVDIKINCHNDRHSL